MRSKQASHNAKRPVRRSAGGYRLANGLLLLHS
jgi:hypothetical protein